MKEIQYKTNISIKDYFPKMKKISYEKYNCEISYNKEKQIIPIKNPENKLFEFTAKQPKCNLTYLITLINTESKMIIGKNNLIIASFRLKQLKETKRIKYEQQVKISLVKKMKENLFGPGVNIGSIYLKLIIDISICFNINNNILLYKLENKSNSINNFIGNNGYDYNLSNLSLSSFLTNLSTLKENKKQSGKNIKNVSSFSNIKYLCTEISSKINKKNSNDNIEINSIKRKIKLLSPNKIINLKKNRTKWHINKEHLKCNSSKKFVKSKNIEKNLSVEKANKNKIRKAFSNENIRNKNSKKIKEELTNKNKRNISKSKIKENINKTERKRTNIKKIIKEIKIYDNNEIKKNIISMLNNIEEKNKELKDKYEIDKSKYSLMKEKIFTQKKTNNLLNEEFEQKNIKNFIHVNINKKANNILLRRMPKIKLNELNIFKIIFNQNINAINKNKKDPKLIIKEKLEQQKQIQLLITLVRNLIKIYGNLSHLYEDDNKKKILIKSLFLRYNIKEKEWNENDDLFDIYENMLKEKEINYDDRYKQEKNEFNTIKEEEDEDLNTIE